MDSLILSEGFENLSLNDCYDISGGLIDEIVLGVAVLAAALLLIGGGALFLGVPMFYSPALTSVA